MRLSSLSNTRKNEKKLETKPSESKMYVANSMQKFVKRGSVMKLAKAQRKAVHLAQEMNLKRSYKARLPERLEKSQKE